MAALGSIAFFWAAHLCLLFLGLAPASASPSPANQSSTDVSLAGFLQNPTSISPAAAESTGKLSDLLVADSQSVGISSLGNATVARQASSSYWLANIKRRGHSSFNPTPQDYKVFRNVLDYGAKGDGVTDDTVAINKAVSDGARCGKGCDSTTTTPALVYFPPGTYMVSQPIVQLYYTQFVGDAQTIPTLKATPDFEGMAVIDSDPYDSTGNSFYTNQNNFYRQVRNFVIDLTAMPANKGAGIHWQVAQATSLQNIHFKMVKGGTNNHQTGVFMDNGSGGFMTDLTFSGGLIGAFFGNQQFTTRNLTFDGCQTAILMNWNWVWALKSVQILNCQIGIDISGGGLTGQTVGSVTLQDSVIANTSIGISTAFNDSSIPVGGGTLVIDNVEFRDSPSAVASASGRPILAGNSLIDHWIQGATYSQANTNAVAHVSRSQGFVSSPARPAMLVDPANGRFFERSRPQYETLATSAFLSVRAFGALGDGHTDDTAAIQKALDSVSPSQVLYFDHGVYIVRDTLRVPATIRITGETWPVLMATGPRFSHVSKPIPMLQVGERGSRGAVEISDLILSTRGPTPGATLVEWNVHEVSQGANGLWDVHWRIGGAAGTNLQSDHCVANSTGPTIPDPACQAAFLLLHITPNASCYIENAWLWVADHELDRADHAQISIFNGRGALIESQGPVWLYGTASEHSQLYQYSFSHASNIFASALQCETPYYQSHPPATLPFAAQPAPYNDPDYASLCSSASNVTGSNGNSTAAAACSKALALRISHTENFFLFGAGLYSFFENYSKDCLATESCQSDILQIEQGKGIHIYALSTKGSTNMITTQGTTVNQADHRSNFCSTLALFDTRDCVPSEYTPLLFAPAASNVTANI